MGVGPLPVREVRGLIVTRAGRAYLTVATLAVLLCGCVSEGGDINDNPNAGTPQDQYNTLLRRPDIEEATHKYKKLLEELRALFVEKFGLPPWEFRDETPVGEASCGFDFPDVRGDQGLTRTIDGGYTRAPIPPGKWEEAVASVTQVVEKYGFTDPKTIADGPKDHQVQYFDGTGTRLDFGYIDNTILAVSTGCFLTPEAHRRGAPLPSSER